MIRYTSFLSVLCASIFLYACSDNEMTGDELVRQYIDAGKLAAENRSHTELADLIYKNYRDSDGLNKQQLIAFVRGYFFRHKNIHLFIKIDEIFFETDNLAFITLHIAMAGNVITDANALTSLRANIYKFDLQLIKDDEWLLKSASWQKAAMKDIL